MTVPIFDMHADLFMDLVRRAEKNREAGPPELETRHLRRLRAGGIFGAVLTDCRMAGETAEPIHFEEFISIVRKELTSAPGIIQVRVASDITHALLTGAFAAVVGYEGLSAAQGDISWIERLYKEAGLRVAILTHNDDNLFGGGLRGVRGGLPIDEALGLTERGREAVTLMNQLGILVDMAHAGIATRRDILETSKRPVILSHVLAKAVYDNGRNLSDDEMRIIADKGGLIGCMTSAAALAPINDRHHHTLERYTEHVLHMVNAAGVDHIGLGLHFCEYLYTPDKYPLVEGLEDASHAQAIIKALLDAGLSEDDIEKIAWKNFIRVFSQAVG